MNGDLIRYAVAAAVLWYVFAGPAAVTPGQAGPYTGSMSSLHAAAASMEAKDREVLSEALDAAGIEIPFPHQVAVPYGDEDVVPVVRVRTVDDDNAELKATNR